MVDAIVWPDDADMDNRRVHVSSRTLGFLGDQFHVEAAHGERKEEVLRMAGIETYFILSAKNPVRMIFSLVTVCYSIAMISSIATDIGRTKTIQFIMPLFCSPQDLISADISTILAACVIRRRRKMRQFQPIPNWTKLDSIRRKITVRVYRVVGSLRV